MSIKEEGLKLKLEIQKLENKIIHNKRTVLTLNNENKTLGHKHKKLLNQMMELF